MLVVMQSHATPDEIRAICERIEALGFRAHSVEGTERYAVAVTGDLSGIETCGLRRPSGRTGNYPHQQALQVGESRIQAGKHGGAIS